MKKILVFAVVLGLLVPAAAFAKAEFSLGGFVKLDTFWDSTQATKNMNTITVRNTDPNNQHGNLRFTAQGSRFNFTIKGPKVFGAQTTGFIEMDFDSTTNINASASNSYVPRLRHAMFRLNWPATELLFGQYWSLFSSWYAESAQDGPFQVGGTPTARLPQIRITQKFASDWSVIGLVGDANGNGPYNNNPYSVNSNSGTAAETPQVQGSVKYSHDWWGKAAYYGHPIPFTAQVMGGWQRQVFRTTNFAPNAINQVAMPFGRATTTYMDPWLAMGSLFLPIIPTHSANLSGTASLLAQAWIGQGSNAFGFTGDGTGVVNFNNNVGTIFRYDVSLLERWGVLLEAQYYFTNQWYLNVAYNISKTIGAGSQGINQFGFSNQGYTNANGQVGSQQEIDATLWFRPVQALKFGLQYSYAQANYWTRLGNNNVAFTPNMTNIGAEHRVEFVGYFYF